MMVTSSLASIPGHADCPKVVAGRGGEGCQNQDCVFKSGDPQIKLIIWFLSSKQVTKSNELSEQRRASRSATHTQSGQDSKERVAISPAVTLADVDGASPGTCGAPGSLPGPG